MILLLRINETGEFFFDSLCVCNWNCLLELLGIKVEFFRVMMNVSGEMVRKKNLENSLE
jgi:hypothetical protein